MQPVCHQHRREGYGFRHVLGHCLVPEQSAVHSLAGPSCKGAVPDSGYSYKWGLLLGRFPVAAVCIPHQLSRSANTVLPFALPCLPFAPFCQSFAASSLPPAFLGHVVEVTLQLFLVLSMLLVVLCCSSCRPAGVHSGPCPALPCPALPCPALPCPALPCPALPLPLDAILRSVCKHQCLFLCSY